MTRTVAVPLWLLLLILVFAGVTVASHFLVPSVRWFFRRRMERVVARLNTRLRRPIAPFRLARRFDMIQRLIYDPEVARAVAADARRRGIPEAVSFEQARRFAREIVPAFSATAYFTVGIRMARWISRALYRVRLIPADLGRLDSVDGEAAVVLVMNHRSNMDYVLVTWLVSGASDLSYAVGEWARVWPLSAMIRAMGAYFIRRRDRGPLYRRVLARYVQMAVAGGVTQAIFPEGRLSLDGRMGPPRLGLLSYMIEGAREGGRDVVFVPVAINYDRVIEDAVLVRAGRTGLRRFRPPLLTVLRGLWDHAWRRVTRRFHGFGTVAAALGEPLSLRAFLQGAPEAPAEALAAELMGRVAAAVPVLPVPLVARRLLLAPEGPVPLARLAAGVEEDLRLLAARGVALPRREARELVAGALAILRERGVRLRPEGVVAPAGLRDLLAFYAGSVAHHFERPPAPAVEAAAAAATAA